MEIFMKKLIILLAAFLVFSVTVSAQEAVYNSAGDLFAAWDENFPDYICGVWSTNGGTKNLTFGIPENELGEAGKQEILDLIEDDSTASFVYQKYSKNYLLSIMKDMDEYFEKHLGLTFAGVNDWDNRVTLGIIKERAENDEQTKAMINELREKYGDAIEIEHTNSYVTLYTTDVKNEILSGKGYMFFTSAAALIFAFAAALGFTAMRRRALVTSNGETVTAEHHITKKQTKDLIKNSVPDFPKSLDRKIYDSISKR